MPPTARWFSRLIWRSRRLNARTTSAMGGITTKAIRVSFQLESTRIASSARIVTESRTSTVSTPVEAEARLFTSLVNLATSCAVGTSSKYAGGRRSTLPNMARRRSRITLLLTHADE